MRTVQAILMMASVLLVSCGRSPTAAKPSPKTAVSGKLAVFVSIPPQAFFVERVGGVHVEVGVLVGPGQNPHVFTPTSEQMIRLANARALFTVGMPFEQAILKKVGDMNRDLKLVDTRKGIKLRAMTEPHEHEEEEGEHKEHGAGEPDPHVWLDPNLVKVQAATICDALCQLDPPHAEEFRRNLKAFQDDLDALHAKLSKALAPLKGKAFFVFHPAFGYLADAYGLKQVAIETGGKDPSAKHLQRLIEEARKSGVRVIFVQKQFPTRSAEAIAHEIKGAVVQLDDLDRDYLANMERMTAEIEKAVK